MNTLAEIPRGTRVLIAGAFVAAAVFAAYGRIMEGEFLNWDDYGHTVNNPHINNPHDQNLAILWRKPYRSHYVPVSYMAFAAEVQLATRMAPGGAAMDPRVFHAGSVLLHVGCALMAMAILLRLVGQVQAACIGALAFALHPIQVEAVAWISETRGLLAALFSLLSIWAYLHFASLSPLFVRRWPWYLGATLAYFVAILSKPTAVAALPMIAVVDCLICKRTWWQVTKSLVWWIPPTIAIVVVNKAAQPDQMLDYIPPLLARPLVAGDSLMFYLYKICLPTSYGPDYGRTPAWVLSQPWLYVAWLVPLALLWVLYRQRDRRWLAAGLLFVTALSPLLGLMSFVFQDVSTTADRYAYLAMLGPALVVSLLLSRIRRSSAWIGAVIAVALLGTLSARQTVVWRDDAHLYTYAVMRNPDSATFLVNLGSKFSDHGQHEKAVAHFQRAVELRPKRFKPRYNLGNAYAAQGQLEQAEQAYLSALAIRSDFVPTRLNLGSIYGLQGRRREAAEQYRQCVKLNPDSSEAMQKLAWILATAPEDNIRDGEEALALAERSGLLSGQPDPLHGDTLAAALAQVGRYEEAIYTAVAAQRLAEERELHDLAAEIHSRVKFYERKQPFRDAATATIGTSR